jgi:V/A-type H+-transporting ATPase subunit D
MPALNVNPTRQELTRLKGRLRTSLRGHKLLKDKRDELMKQFMDVVRENRALRAKVEEGLTRANTAFAAAGAVMSPEMLEQAILYPRESVSLDMDFKNIMSVDVPIYRFETQSEEGDSTAPYGFAATSGELDDAVEALSEVFRDMLRLAEVEKTSQLLAQEIERTRRRVNALEYVKIPQMEEAIKYISMKLDENERSATIRLMKVKDMILKDAIEEKREEDVQALETFRADAPEET